MTKINFVQAMSYLTESATEFEKIRLLALQDKLSKGDQILREHLELQNNDGGIAYQFMRGNKSSIGSTILFFKDFIVMEREDLVKDELEKAITFIISQQSENGYFEEPQYIERYGCFFYESKGYESNQLYCTATALNFLSSTNRKEMDETIENGLRWLVMRWNNEKGFLSYPDTVWLSIPVILKFKGIDDSIGVKGLKMIEKLPLNNYPAFCLVIMLESFITNDLERLPIVHEILESLSEQQLQSGTWYSQCEESFDLLTTLYVLTNSRKLKLF